MKGNKIVKKVIALSTSSFIFVACGNTYTSTITGTAIDGLLSGSTVCLDINSNDSCDSGEPNTTTNSDGTYSLSTEELGDYPILIFGGTDLATGNEFEGQLKDIVELRNTEPKKTATITPLTTIAAEIYQDELSSDSDYTISSARETLATNLGLTSEQITTSPLEDSTVFTKSQQIVQTARLLASSIRSDTDTSSTRDAFKHVVDQIATTVKSDTSGSIDVSKVVTNLQATTYNNAEISISSSLTTYISENNDDIATKVSNISSISELNSVQSEIDSTVVSVQSQLKSTSSNRTPVISGTPSTTISKYSPYSFTPSTLDLNSEDTLTYTITNKPSWASFNTSTGTLSGTPGFNTEGTYSNIIISVSDGTSSSTLSSFSIEVIESSRSVRICPAVVIYAINPSTNVCEFIKGACGIVPSGWQSCTPSTPSTPGSSSNSSPSAITAFTISGNATD